MALSSMRSATGTMRSSASVSSAASGANGRATSRARLIEPNKHAPYGGNGCSPQLCTITPLASKALAPGTLTS